MIKPANAGPDPGTRRLVLIARGGMGDLCLLLSVLQAIKYSNRCRVSVVWLSTGIRDAATLAAGRSAIDEVIDWRSLGYHKIAMGPYPADDRLVELCADAWRVILYDPTTRHEVDALRMLCDDRLAFLTSRVPARRQRGLHLTQWWAECLDGVCELGELLPPRIEGIRPGDEGREHVVCFAPGAGDPAKCWPVEGWTLLRKKQTDGCRDQATVRWWLGAGERTRYREAMLPGDQLIAGETLAERMQQVCGCRLLIGVDSGMSHLAAACGVPTRVIWVWSGRSQQQPGWWRPLGGHVRVIEPPAVMPPVDEVLRLM